ncbi:MAG: hypothetical protein U0637_06250 [Phycisphaerales bacterium]
MAGRFVRSCAVGAAGVLALGAGVLLSMTHEGVAVAAPEPDPVPRRWQLTVEPGPLRVMAVAVGGQAQLYYYMTYRVTNTSGSDQMFTPSFELADDMGDVQRAGRDVPAEVTKAILTRLESPLLQDQVNVVGMLLQGEENAKDGLVVWPVANNHVRALEVYAAGFSGETRTLDAFDPETKGTKRVTLRKTLMLRYQPMGLVREGVEPYSVLEQRWIMR